MSSGVTGPVSAPRVPSRWLPSSPAGCAGRWGLQRTGSVGGYRLQGGWGGWTSGGEPAAPLTYRVWCDREIVFSPADWLCTVKLYEACEGGVNSRSKCWMGSKELLGYSLTPFRKRLLEGCEEKIYSVSFSLWTKWRRCIFFSSALRLITFYIMFMLCSEDVFYNPKNYFFWFKKSIS